MSQRKEHILAILKPRPFKASSNLNTKHIVPVHIIGESRTGISIQDPESQPLPAVAEGTSVDTDNDRRDPPAGPSTNTGKDANTHTSSSNAESTHSDSHDNLSRGAKVNDDKSDSDGIDPETVENNLRLSKKDSDSALLRTGAEDKGGHQEDKDNEHKGQSDDDQEDIDSGPKPTGREKKTEKRCEENTDPSRRSLRKKHNFFKFVSIKQPSDKASRPMVTPAPQPKPKKPHPTVQPAQPAMSKPGPPKLPDTGPVISAEKDKPEQEKGVFTKPALRSTPKSERKSYESDHSEKPVFNVPLKKAAKPDLKQSHESPKHLFETPTLKSTERKITTADEHDNDNTNTSAPPNNDQAFDKPGLRQTKTRNDSADDLPVSGFTFEKPPLKYAVSPGNTREKPDNISSGMFEKPVLKRATPSPEKEVKPATEAKGTFDLPVLRKTGFVSQAEKDRQEQEKPSWLQEAAEKQSKVLDGLQSKDTKPVEKAVVRYSYDGENEDELSLTEGEIINVLDKGLEDSDWWRGDLNGRVGVFPGSLVELIKEEPSDKASRPMVTPAPQPKPKKPHPTVQPAQPAMSKPGPPKLPHTGPVTSAEQDKHEPEKEERQPTVPSKKPIFPSPPLTKKPTKSIDLKDIENIDDGKHGRSLEQDEKLLGICTSFGRKSQQLKDECEIICKRVRKITEVLNVYAAFQETDESIVIFIVSVKAVSDEISKNLTNLGIRFIVKQLDFNKSLISNTKSSVAFQMKDSEVELIRTCISNNADLLMAKHKYLSIVEGCCHKRECGVAIDSSACKYEPRLALYVLAKGYIPIDEDPFERSYDGIQVEVREGVFVPFVKTSNEYHDHVRMGCAIHRHLKGTLGLFIEHNIYGLCGLTCAHAMLSKEEHERCKQTNGRIYSELLLNDCEVYQPEHPHGLGSLVEAIYKEGNDFQTGIDIALVKIKQRHPIDGKFPGSKDGINSESTEINFEFASGKALTPSLNNGRCCKIGQMSGYTEGTLINKEQNSVARDVLEVLGYKFVIYNQLNVKSSTQLFAKPGDSGSPVFVKDGDGEPACIGIVVGGRTCDGVVYVTPINTILQELGISQLKSFVANRFERLEAKVNSIDQKLDFLITKLTSSTGTQ
ncbi:uncharacterized protein LOC127869544 isoform X6 [Dreissena polymorpha]|uniref:uncharacterized protein LOC127869544 isoform X5 n=1 Tax=Dreissena polymorpha TaxID=45954 RepID=UPI002263D5AB|nr:uncharacterized protein LOC127869544 isoform X5 [Dreissena polymorpha]XP_052268153.1 uncharacterized protein LOC127869544 isoform X6 [Dreissena polymorpha]